MDFVLTCSLDIIMFWYPPYPVDFVLSWSHIVIWYLLCLMNFVLTCFSDIILNWYTDMPCSLDFVFVLLFVCFVNNCCSHSSLQYNLSTAMQIFYQYYNVENLFIEFVDIYINFYCYYVNLIEYTWLCWSSFLNYCVHWWFKTSLVPHSDFGLFSRVEPISLISIKVPCMAQEYPQKETLFGEVRELVWHFSAWSQSVWNSKAWSEGHSDINVDTLILITGLVLARSADFANFPLKYLFLQVCFKPLSFTRKYY